MAKRKRGSKRRSKRAKKEKPIMCYGFDESGEHWSETIEREEGIVEALTAGSVAGVLWVRKHGAAWTQRPDIHVSVRQTSAGPEVIMEEVDFKRLAEWACKEHGRSGGTIQSVEPDPEPAMKGVWEEAYGMGV